MSIKIQELVFQIKVHEEGRRHNYAVDSFKLTSKMEEEYKKIIVASMNHCLDEREER